VDVLLFHRLDKGVGVEKLFPGKITKIESRQEALTSEERGSPRHFLSPKFCLGPKESFSTPTGDYAQESVGIAV
jgi:hypothetical protein